MTLFKLLLVSSILTLISSATNDEIRLMFRDANHASNLCSQTLLRGFFRHWALSLYGFQHWKEWWVFSWRFFRLQSLISTYFWHELQQRVSWMPNSIQLFKFLLETLVDSFFALFCSIEDASSFESVGWGRLLWRVERIMMVPTTIWFAAIGRRAK